MNKIQSLISGWARQEYGGPEYMCKNGRAVYNIIVKLERKGKTPAEIVAFFERRNKEAINNFVVNRLWERLDEPDYEDHLYMLGLVLKGDHDYLEEELHSPEFKKALKAEIKRIEELEAATPKELQGTPVFRQKDGRVEVTFKKSLQRKMPGKPSRRK